jgi:hypothetical protein
MPPQNMTIPNQIISIANIAVITLQYLHSLYEKSDDPFRLQKIIRIINLAKSLSNKLDSRVAH